MHTRRAFVVSVAAATSLALERASAADAVFAGKPTEDTPQATVIAGKPPILDFGEGLKVPCDKSAFLTLWEGKSFWLTFGAGRATYVERAQGMAVLHALGAMKLLLMTLAFTPERLVQENGGWRLKVQDTSNYVLGDIQLPGKPYWPINDAGFSFDRFSGAGDLSSPGLNAPATAATRSDPGLPLSDPTGGFAKVDAYTTFILLKKNLSLDDVRARAQILIR